MCRVKSPPSGGSYNSSSVCETGFLGGITPSDFGVCFGSANNAGDKDSLESFGYAQLAIHRLLKIMKVQVPECTLSVEAVDREGAFVAGTWHVWSDEKLMQDAGAGWNISSMHKDIAVGQGETNAIPQICHLKPHDMLQFQSTGCSSRCQKHVGEFRAQGRRDAWLGFMDAGR